MKSIQHHVSTLTTILVLGILFATPAFAGDVTASGPGAVSAAQGDALLAQGKIEDAYKAYAKASRAEPKNKTYLNQAMSMKRVVGLRRFVAKSKPGERWLRAVKSLHLFYIQSGLPHLAVDIDKKAFEAMKTAETAAWLAEAHLAAGQNAEATNLLAPYSGTSPQHAVYHTIALARLGQLDAAKKVSKNALVVNKELTPQEGYDYARMWNLLGKPDSSLLLLKSAFERTPAPALPTFKKRVYAEPDFASLANLPAFAEVMKTQSTVKETCSGGSSCAGCPNRGKCGGG